MGHVQVTCQWTENEDGVFKTACGNKWKFIAGTPESNRMPACDFCGKPLVVVPYTPQELK